MCKLYAIRPCNFSEPNIELSTIFHVVGIFFIEHMFENYFARIEKNRKRAIMSSDIRRKHFSAVALSMQSHWLLPLAYKY